jgi:DNA-directed RNA polymerase subunit E'/Rpb7
MDPLFERRELVRNVHINSKFMQKNIQASLLANLRTNFEGNCSSEGYIQSGSITILDYSIGRANYVKGGVDYSVRFQADICLPHKGQVFKSNVTVRSKIGIHAETLPIKVLIPRDLHIGNAEFDAVEVGQDVEFEVSGCQFKQRDRDIIVLGMLRSALKAAPLPSLISREEVSEVTNIPLSTSGDEKLVTIVNTAEPEKKKRKLKKPDVVVPNEPNKEGMVENTD